MKKRKQNAEYSYLNENGKYKKIRTKLISKKISEIYGNDYHWFDLFLDDILYLPNKKSIYDYSGSNHLRAIFLLNNNENKKYQKQYGSSRLYVVAVIKSSLKRPDLTPAAKIRLEKVLDFYNDETNFITISEEEYNENNNANSENIAKHLSIICPISPEIYKRLNDTLNYLCSYLLFLGLFTLLILPFLLLGFVIFSLISGAIREKEFYFDFFYSRKSDSFEGYIFLNFTFPIILLFLWIGIFYPFAYFNNFLFNFDFINFFVFSLFCFWIFPFVLFMFMQHNYIVALRN